MTRDADHGKGGRGSPDDKVALISKRKFKEIWKFAVHDSKENRVSRTKVACCVRAAAEN